MTKEDFMRKAIELSNESVENGGGPFGAVIARGDTIIAWGSNSVTIKNDPTAHAEITAIREACYVLNTFKLQDCDFYTSCEPCPMCLSAAYWAGINKIYYGNTKEDARDIGFDDSFIYEEICLAPADRRIEAVNMLREEAQRAFKMWEIKPDKTEY